MPGILPATPPVSSRLLSTRFGLVEHLRHIFTHLVEIVTTSIAYILLGLPIDIMARNHHNDEALVLLISGN